MHQPCTGIASPVEKKTWLAFARLATLRVRSRASRIINYFLIRLDTIGQEVVECYPIHQSPLSDLLVHITS
jgi:hypothetical protein